MQYSEIAAELQVSKSTAYEWTKNIVLTDKNIVKLSLKQEKKFVALAISRDVANKVKND